MGEIFASNIQGIVANGFTHRHSVHLIFHAPTAENARQLISALLATPFGILSAERWIDRPKTILQISLTAKCFELLGIDLADFPTDFIKGPTRDPSSIKWLGDIGDSKSDNWWDNQTDFSSKAHGCIHGYAESEDDLQELLQKLTDLLNQLSVKELFPWKNNRRIEAHWLPDDTIHFGYLDGISQPPVAFPWNQSGSLDPSYFLLGIGKPDEMAFVPKPENNPATNFGTYLVLRVIEQNVPKFNQYLQTHGNRLEGVIADSNQSGADILAAKLVGRWKNGSPLILEPTNPNTQLPEENDFNYADDRKGIRCPFSAHIRVTNPRANEDLEEVSKPLRPLIRRGVPYGSQLNPPDSTIDDGIERGLVGIFLCSNIERQLEIVSKWMQDNSFRVDDRPDPKTDPKKLNHQDALLGSSQNTSSSPTIYIPTEKDPVEVPLPDVLKTRGTLYLLLPSITSLEKLANNLV
jgi:deferrochelatase/peroxidase EfeB